MDNQIKLWPGYIPAHLCDQTLYEFECILKDPKYSDHLKFNFSNNSLLYSGLPIKKLVII